MHALIRQSALVLCGLLFLFAAVLCAEVGAQDAAGLFGVLGLIALAIASKAISN